MDCSNDGYKEKSHGGHKDGHGRDFMGDHKGIFYGRPQGIAPTIDIKRRCVNIKNEFDTPSLSFIRRVLTAKKRAYLFDTPSFRIG